MLRDDFQFPGAIDTSRRGLLRVHARALARAGGGRGGALTEENCALPEVLDLINSTYAQVHNLRTGPFTRADQILEWFDEDGDGRVSASEFAEKMKVRVPGKAGGSKVIFGRAGRHRSDNDFRVEARLAQTRRVVEAARSDLIHSLEGGAGANAIASRTIVLSDVARALKAFVDTFAHLGHARLVNHRFLELSECTARLPASALVSRAGVRALDLLRAQIEEDAATLISRWSRRVLSGGASAGSNGSTLSSGAGGADFWSATLRKMTEMGRLAARQRARKEMRARARAREETEKRRATEKMQAFFRTKLAARQQKQGEDGKEGGGGGEGVMASVSLDEENEHEGRESMFDSHRRKMREAQGARARETLKRQRLEVKRFMEDPFVHGFLGYRRSKRPQLADFWSGPAASSGIENASIGGIEEVSACKSTESAEAGSESSRRPIPQRPWTSQGRYNGSGGSRRNQDGRGSDVVSEGVRLSGGGGRGRGRGVSVNQSRPTRPATAAGRGRGDGGGVRSSLCFRKKKQLQLYSRPMLSVKRQRVMRASKAGRANNDEGMSMVYVSQKLRNKETVLRMPSPRSSVPAGIRASGTKSSASSGTTRNLRLLPNGFESLGK